MQHDLPSDDGDSDYEDVEDEVVDLANDDEAAAEQDDLLLLSKVYNRRLRAIPDLSQLLKKEPASTLPYLMASNLASFLFYSRYYNGNLLDTDCLKITAALTE